MKYIRTKYIRTKDRIIDVTYWNKDKQGYYTYLTADWGEPKNYVYIENIIKEADTIKELCDELAKVDKRIVIIKPRVNIKKMLNKEGYPFKSKQHSQNYGVYFRNREKIQEIVKKIENEPKLAFNYDFIHNLERGTKGIIKYIFGVRERVLYEYSDCP